MSGPYYAAVAYQVDVTVVYLYFKMYYCVVQAMTLRDSKRVYVIMFYQP